MHVQQLCDKYYVCAQIAVGDIKPLQEAGFHKIICNRPNEEVSNELHSSVMAIAAQEAGIEFNFLPLTMQTINSENISKQASFVEEANGPVLAYCASGTRCTIVWALIKAGKLPTADILTATANAGFNLEGIRNLLNK